MELYDNPPNREKRILHNIHDGKNSALNLLGIKAFPLWIKDFEMSTPKKKTLK
jgi:hypothetical protein